MSCLPGKLDIDGFGAGNKMIDPHVILAMPFNFILSSSHLYYRIPSFYYGNATLHAFSCLSYHEYCDIISTN